MLYRIYLYLFRTVLRASGGLCLRELTWDGLGVQGPYFAFVGLRFNKNEPQGSPPTMLMAEGSGRLSCSLQFQLSKDSHAGS